MPSGRAGSRCPCACSPAKHEGMPRVARLSRQEFDSAQLRPRSQMPGYRSRSRPPLMLGTPRSRSYSLSVSAPQGCPCASSSGSAHGSSRTRRPALLRTYWLHPLARGQAVAVLPATTSRSGKNRVVCAQGLNLLCEGLPSMRVHYVRAETALRNRARRVSFPRKWGGIQRAISPRHSTSSQAKYVTFSRL